MSDYLLEFEAHIVEDKRPEGFPHSVFVRQQYTNIESDEQLKELYNHFFTQMVKNPGITVYPDNQIIDTSRVRFDQRIYVPWHMISHFQGDVKLVTPAQAEKTSLESLTPVDPAAPEKGKTVIQ